MTPKKILVKGENLFAEMGLKRLEGDKAVYYMMNKEGNLDRMISTCVDDFV